MSLNKETKSNQTNPTIAGNSINRFLTLSSLTKYKPVKDCKLFPTLESRSLTGFYFINLTKTGSRSSCKGDGIARSKQNEGKIKRERNIMQTFELTFTWSGRSCHTSRNVIIYKKKIYIYIYIYIQPLRISRMQF